MAHQKLDKNNNANLIDYAGEKSRTVVMSVLAEETFVLAYSCDAEIVIQHDRKQMLGNPLKYKP